MFIARILYPIEVLGPGKRVGIWFCGCPRRCKGCSNPELWEFNDRYKTSIDTVIDLINRVAINHIIDGFTITGGDPFYQSHDLAALLKELKTITDDIIVYTGYKKSDIDSKYLDNISVLIDGEYIEELNNNELIRGSSNQEIYILDENKIDKYQSYFKNETNKVQNFFTLDGVVSVGIHKPGF